MSQFVARLGFSGGRRERSLLLVGSKAAAFEALAPLLDEIGSRDSRLRIILASGDPALRTWLSQRFPALLVTPLPFANAVAAELYLRQLKIRAIAFVEGSGAGLPTSLLVKFRQLAIGIVIVTGRGVESLEDISQKNFAVELTAVIGNGLDQADLPPEISVLNHAALADHFDVMLARDLKALRKPGRLAILFNPQRWRWAVSWRFSRIDTLDGLKQRLAAPATILCLGNGPSSADPALLAVPHDVLFRVNHSWLDKKFMIRPDVVFTGGRPTLRALDGVVFGLQNLEAEDRLVQTRAFNPLRSHSTYFNVNDLTEALQRFDWGHLRPTNGASMIAAAIALRPKKLVVAGIDLFQHADGTYPGESAIPNAYAPAHSRETELEFLLQQFSGFQGEIIIHGDILRTAWEAHRAKAGQIDG